MKKFAAMLMTLCILLTGCSTTSQAEKKTSVETQAEETVFIEETVPAEETTAPTEPETQPEEPTQPQEPEVEETPAPEETKPQQTTQQSAPQQTTQQTTQQSAPQQTTNTRPTSSATCKDTGSGKVWDDPVVHAWEETDPRRTKYISNNTNSTYDTMIGGYGGLVMYLGHTYGMPFLHNGDASDLLWYSSDPTVATVNDVGFVTPLKEGKTTIGFMADRWYTRTVYVRAKTVYTEAQLEQMAKEEAKRIADYVMSLPVETDLERIGAAALIVNKYMGEGYTIPNYTIADDGSISCNVVGYNRPFGTLVTGYSTCAGDVRALGLILEYMGFEWYHVNANQWDHQWCVVYDVDGQTAFADGASYGVVGYGERQEDGSNWKQYNRPIELTIELKNQH